MSKRSIITAIAIAAVLAFGLQFFFTFTNTGFGLLSHFENKAKGDPPVPARNEIVMPPGSTLTATTAAGSIRIEAGQGLKRTYSWEGATRSVVMWPRGKRWYGSLGLYYAGPGSHWFPKHNGISRGVLEEGQRHFDTREDAAAWLKERIAEGCVYNDRGLAVCFSKNLSREQLNVGVWQIDIAGAAPSGLEGSRNDAIQTSWQPRPAV